MEKSKGNGFLVGRKKIRGYGEVHSNHDASGATFFDHLKASCPLLQE